MIFKQMVELQNEFNKRVHPQWQEQNYNWMSAIIVESGELLESLGYKWWKHQEPDMNNVKVEAIDLLHFLISYQIEVNYQHPKIKDFNEAIKLTIDRFERCFTEEEEDNIKDESIEMLVKSLIVFWGFGKFNAMKAIFNRLNMSNEDIYLAYVIKNCLNEFRQKHGYKEGTYIKNWNGKEDNKVAYEIADEWGAEDLTYEQLYIDLEAAYEEVEKKHKIS
ncbi:dUTP diphosphatase [Halarcobacter anaerophilus]|uniref:dUTPase n=1 Tax=Halarcobacter anaerophilus TaxID=877500 RepID=A0A4Q0Y0N6_9BACT|nr:dUTP diphosphatase [Halarcobacter anaerophilus]QDF28952.1 dUTPase [Halarcobacter anaerophilus]RXJ63587.1 hypothetical protein CRV06_05185 [Halarcobacter anaerophilus]